MDLEAPLRTLASPVEAETLRVLAGADTEFTAPQIHRLAPSASAFGVRKALARLAESGLVTSTRHGNAVTWSGNRAHLLWPAVEVAVAARAQLIERIRDQVRRDKGVDAYLYGSFARRQSEPDSDIDVLLVFPDQYSHERVLDSAIKLSDGIESWTGNRAQMFSVSRSELRDSAHRGDPIVTSFRADAIPVVGPDFAKLLQNLETDADG